MSEFNEETPLDQDSERAKLKSLITAQEEFLAHPIQKAFAQDIQSDIEGTVNRITMVMPRNLEELFAHFAEIGQLSGLRTVQQRPLEALSALKAKLAELPEE